MTTVANYEFAKHMLLLGQPAEHIQPMATHDPDGDSTEFLIKPDSFRAERVDDLITTYYSQDTGGVIGSLIKGVSKFCQRMFRLLPGFRLQISERVGNAGSRFPCSTLVVRF